VKEYHKIKLNLRPMTSLQFSAYIFILQIFNFISYSPSVKVADLVKTVRYELLES